MKQVLRSCIIYRKFNTRPYSYPKIPDSPLERLNNGSPFIVNNTQQFVANHNIQWKFSIAEAPWYGGFWERLISQVKRCLKKTLGKTSLDFYELQTVLSHCVITLN